ncbi:transposase [Marinomonas gallaica]|uniref:transposase n=1 Tax=Marinomonas gallaica TaxID=1806667 RepID=UPI003A91A377
MARLPRLCPIGIPQHIIQRGNNRQVCFASEDDFIAYAHWLTEYAHQYQVKVHAWVFMTNHVHLLATPMIEGGISKMMQALGRRYVRYFNHTYQRTGTLWEGRFKSCVISAEKYFFICQRYIELNPVRANMVSHPADYKWSSYRFHAQESLELQSGLWQPHELYLKLSRQQRTRAKRYQALFKYHISDEELGRIRSATHSDMALGNARFKDEIEQLTGRRVTSRKRGRKPSQV